MVTKRVDKRNSFIVMHASIEQELKSLEVLTSKYDLLKNEFEAYLRQIDTMTHS